MKISQSLCLFLLFTLYTTSTSAPMPHPYQGEKLLQLIGMDYKTPSFVNDFEQKYQFKGGNGNYWGGTIKGLSINSFNSQFITSVSVFVGANEIAFSGTLPFGLTWAMNMDEAIKQLERQEKFSGFDYRDETSSYHLYFYILYKNKPIKCHIEKSKTNNTQRLDFFATEKIPPSTANQKNIKIAPSLTKTNVTAGGYRPTEIISNHTYPNCNSILNAQTLRHLIGRNWNTDWLVKQLRANCTPYKEEAGRRRHWDLWTISQKGISIGVLNDKIIEVYILHKFAAANPFGHNLSKAELESRNCYDVRITTSNLGLQESSVFFYDSENGTIQGEWYRNPSYLTLFYYSGNTTDPVTALINDERLQRQKTRFAKNVAEIKEQQREDAKVEDLRLSEQEIIARFSREGYDLLSRQDAVDEVNWSTKPKWGTYRFVALCLKPALPKVRYSYAHQSWIAGTFSASTEFCNWTLQETKITGDYNLQVRASHKEQGPFRLILLIFRKVR